ncbi:MAG: diphthine synthase [Thermoplasmata archaeon]
MGLSFIGLGLFDEKDISLKGLEAARACEYLFAEFYTATLSGTTVESLERLLGKPINVLVREEVERGDRILELARRAEVGFLVVGDPFTATTHIELRIRAHRAGIPVSVVHGSSVYTSVPGLLGLQHYKFGRTTSLPFPEKGFFPKSPYEVIRENTARGLHTLVLLDIQAERGRLMTANEALEIMLALEAGEGGGVLKGERLVCVVARAGSMTPVVRAGSIERLRHEGFGPPHHTIVVPGRLHFMEAEALVELAGAPKEILEDRGPGS